MKPALTLSQQYKQISRAQVSLIRNPQFWSTVIIFVLITLHHYDNLTSFSIFSAPDIPLGLTRHTIDRILYLVPISLSSFTFGSRGGKLSVIIAFLAMLPRALFISPGPATSILETAVITLIGGLVPISLDYFKSQEEQLEATKEKLELVKQELDHKAQLSEKQENQLLVINTFSKMLSQSFELEELMKVAIEIVTDIVETEPAFIFSIDEKNEKMNLISHKGIDEESVKLLDGISVGENTCGQVALTGQASIIDDIYDDSIFCNLPTEENFRSGLSVPLVANGKTIGTICVVSRTKCRFSEPDIELLSALGNLIGIAIYNARLQKNQAFYLKQITSGYEEERQRISRDLHDSTAQSLIAIQRQLEKYIEENGHLPLEKLYALENIYKQLKDNLHDIRQICRDLRPSVLDNLGLFPAVEWLAGQIEDEHNIRADLTITGEKRRFSPEIEITLFRIIQEALRNVAKHAQATEVRVDIELESDLTKIEIKDNGRGFELPITLGDLSLRGKLGIDGMQTRAKLAGGTFDIKTASDQGTLISVTIPA